MYYASDAWSSTLRGPFATPLTTAENMFMRNWEAQGSINKGEEDDYIWVQTVDWPNLTDATNSYQGDLQFTRTTDNNYGVHYNANDVAINAWQNGKIAATPQFWSSPPALIRAPLTTPMGYSLITAGGLLTGYKVASSGKNPAYAAAWNNYVYANYGQYPQTVAEADAIFGTDTYFYGLFTAPVQTTDSYPLSGTSLRRGSKYYTAYIEAIQRQWGPNYGV